MQPLRLTKAKIRPQLQELEDIHVYRESKSERGREGERERERKGEGMKIVR